MSIPTTFIFIPHLAKEPDFLHKYFPDWFGKHLVLIYLLITHRKNWKVSKVVVKMNFIIFEISRLSTRGWSAWGWPPSWSCRPPPVSPTPCRTWNFWRRQWARSSRCLHCHWLELKVISIWWDNQIKWIFFSLIIFWYEIFLDSSHKIISDLMTWALLGYRESAGNVLLA